MHVAAMIMAILVAVEHLFILWLEMFNADSEMAAKRLEFHGKRYSRRQCNYCLKIKGYITVSWPSVFYTACL